MNVVTTIYVLGCAATLYSAFCRLALMSRETTRRDVRFSFVALATAASAALIAVAAGHEPTAPDAVVVLATGLALASSSRAWRGDVPEGLRRGRGDGRPE